jgi:hypothetical protein
MLHGYTGYVRYSGRRHPDANVFRQVELRLREIGSVTSRAEDNVGHPWTVQTPAIENLVIPDISGANVSL